MYCSRGLICDTPSIGNSYDYNYCHHLSNPVPHPALLRSLALESVGDRLTTRDLVRERRLQSSSQRTLTSGDSFCLLDTSAPSPLSLSLLFLYASLACLAVSCLIRHVMCHIM